MAVESIARQADSVADMAQAAEAAGDFPRARDLFDRAAGLYGLARNVAQEAAMRQGARTAAAAHLDRPMAQVASLASPAHGTRRAPFCR